MQFLFHANQSHFHKNGFALRLALKQRHKRTRKWPIRRRFIFYHGMSQLGKSVQYAYRSKTLLRLNIHQQRVIRKDTEN